MGENLQFYAIYKKDLEKLPEGVKKFFKDFFEEKMFFGEECLVALSSGDKSPWCLMEDKYSEGLDEEEINDCGIFSWIEKNPEIIFNYNWS